MSKHERRTINSFTYPLVFLLTCQPVNPKQCQFFSMTFNIMSALSAHQPPILPQKIDSREGLFGGKKGFVCEHDKMNVYSKKPPFVPHLGLFAAKYSAICGKTQRILVLNAVRFGAKCSAF